MTDQKLTSSREATHPGTEADEAPVRGEEEEGEQRAPTPNSSTEFQE